MSAYEVSIISIIGINVILAVSLNMISGFCGQISLGHGAFFGAGAYAAALTMVGSRKRSAGDSCIASHWQCAWESSLDSLRFACVRIFWRSPRSG